MSILLRIPGIVGLAIASAMCPLRMSGWAERREDAGDRATPAARPKAVLVDLLVGNREL